MCFSGFMSKTAPPHPVLTGTEHCVRGLNIIWGITVTYIRICNDWNKSPCFQLPVGKGKTCKPGSHHWDEAWSQPYLTYITTRPQAPLLLPFLAARFLRPGARKASPRLRMLRMGPGNPLLAPPNLVAPAVRFLSFLGL